MVILDTAHTFWKVLMSMYTTFNIDNNMTFTINCNYKTNATHRREGSTLEQWVCLNILNHVVILKFFRKPPLL
jgi:hypothetical protein